MSSSSSLSNVSSSPFSLATMTTTTMATMATTISVLDCPEYTESDSHLLELVSLYVEGYLQTLISLCGIVGNSLASIILTRKEMRNAFNLLLVIMACFDSTYLLGCILESIRKQFSLDFDLHLLLFPHVLYPIHQIAITASIFMTVAIALERFYAVHFPINYNQAMHEANALTKRMLKYVITVTILAVLFTLTRFFEAKVVVEAIPDPHNSNNTVDVLVLHPTQLRTTQWYIYYFNISRLIVLGIIPFLCLVVLKLLIYRDVQARKNRRLTHHQRGHTLSGGPKSAANPDKEGDATGLTAMKSAAAGNVATLPSAVTVNESRRKKEDNLAFIFLGFILVFLVCHFPRLVLNIHELATLTEALKCQQAGLKAFPLWSLLLVSVSHLLLAINSSTNILIYCCLSSQFRQECSKVANKVIRERLPCSTHHVT